MGAWLPSKAGDGFDWQGDAPLRLPMEDLVIYEMHVRGFTQHPSSGVEVRGARASAAVRLRRAARGRARSLRSTRR